MLATPAFLDGFGLTTAEKVVVNVLDEQRIYPLSIGESNYGSSVSVYDPGSAAHGCRGMSDSKEKLLTRGRMTRDMVNGCRSIGKVATLCTSHDGNEE